jgi:hypothetical protein
LFDLRFACAATLFGPGLAKTCASTTKSTARANRSTQHIAEFFALFGGGLRDPGWEGTPKYSRARLAIVPGYTHYNFGMGPDVARVIEAYLNQPTSKATQFKPSM